MSWTIGTVTLLKSPSKFKHTLPANIETFKVDGGTAIPMGNGLDIETLTLSFPLFSSSYNIDQIMGTYVAALEAYRNTAVAIVTPYSSLNGTYLLTSFDYEKSNEDAAGKIECNAKFVKNGTVTIIIL